MVVLLIVHRCFFMTLSRKIIVFKQTLQTSFFLHNYFTLVHLFCKNPFVRFSRILNCLLYFILSAWGRSMLSHTRILTLSCLKVTKPRSYLNKLIKIKSAVLSREPHRSTRLLQLTGCWQHDGIMWLALRSAKSNNFDFLNQIRYFSIK